MYWSNTFNIIEIIIFIYFNFIKHERTKSNKLLIEQGSPGGSKSKESACDTEDLGWEDPLEKEMATCSSILAWRIPWAEEPGRLQSMGVTKSQTQLSD